MKHLVLCADDYAIAPGVSRAIRELAALRRLNATSVMALGPHLHAEAKALLAVAPPGFQIGLHLTLTGGLKPLTGWSGGRLSNLPALMSRSFARQLDRTALRREIEAQFIQFHAAFGQMPHFVDGHQHVHLLPQIRDVVIEVTRSLAPHAWLRQCRGPHGAGIGMKGAVIAALSNSLRRDGARHGLVLNPAFSGAYPLRGDEDFAEVFTGFLRDLPDHALVMCHPGYVDDELRQVDPIHDARENEMRFFCGPAYEPCLEKAGFKLF